MSHRDAPRPGAAPSTRRVLEPEGAAPSAATHLDPDPRLRTGELLVDLELVALDAAGETGVARASGGRPDRQRAALLEAATQRGGLPPDLAGSSLVGRIAEAEGQPDLVGTRIGVVPPVAGVPLWLRDVSGWHGGRFVPCRGHAVLADADAVVRLPDDVAVEAAGLLTGAGSVPALVGRALRARDDGGAVVVIGAGTVAGALALRTAAAAGRDVVATVTSLAEARLARALGATTTVVAPLEPPAGGRDTVLEELGDSGVAGPSTVVLAESRPGSTAAAALLASALRADVVAVEPADVPLLVAEAAGAGCSPLVVAGRTLEVTSGQRRDDLRGIDQLLRDLAAWRAGTGAAPDPAGPEDV